jgi:hypothetical protein
VLGVERGDQASGWGRPASTTHEALRPLPEVLVFLCTVCGRALRLTMRASSTSSPTRTPAMTRSVESMYRT